MRKGINLQREIEKEKKKFSFVVPVWKTERYLKDCLQSLLNQDYTNLEIIVISDGKSQKAKKIFTQLRRKDKRLTKFVAIKHGGAPKARNEGFKYTTGDYVSFWDSDCYATRGMVRMWAKSFLADPKASFVYSGYRFNDQYESFVESEPFNAYLLTCYNYIATMFPMKRELFPGFDESLKSLQDWDLWLTLSQKGHHGYFCEGSGFITEPPRKGSISAKGCHPNEWLKRKETVRKKHKINDRNIAFASLSHKFRGSELARMFNQDYLDSSQYHHFNKYKLIYLLGFYGGSMDQASLAFKKAPQDCKRVLHWIGDDVESVFMVPYKIVKLLMELFKKTIDKHYCENEQSRKMLKELGIKAEILPLPMKYEKIPMPKKEFKVFYEDDKGTRGFMQSVIKACPDIKFESFTICDLAEYACFLSLTGSIMPSENMKRFASAGRHIITNYPMLYAGNVGLDRDKVIKKIRQCRRWWKSGKKDKKAQAYYQKMINPKDFKRKVIDAVR
jgi:glycosyltransferase involved in cell wall biosynthesis